MLTVSDVGFGSGGPSFCQVALCSWSKEYPVCPSFQVCTYMSITRDCLILRRGWMASWIPSTHEASELDPLVLNLMCVDPRVLSDISGSSNSLSTSGKSRWRQFWNAILWELRTKNTMCLGWGGEKVRRRVRKRRQMVKQPKSITRCEVLTLELLNGVHLSRW